MNKIERKAHRMYNQILNKVVKPIVGNGITFQDSLDNVGRDMFGSAFKGVFASDKIPRLNALKKYAILNLDRSDEQGSHWIAIAFQNGKTYVYDSFGRKSSRIIPTLFHSGNGRILDSDPDPEQKIKEENCGARSLAWLLFFHRYGPNMAMHI
jgi:hypothetical protein